jgi:hypothetical protein
LNRGVVRSNAGLEFAVRVASGGAQLLALAGIEIKRIIRRVELNVFDALAYQLLNFVAHDLR